MNMEIDFNEVYEEFHPKILHYLSRLTNPHNAEDCIPLDDSISKKWSEYMSRFRFNL